MNDGVKLPSQSELDEITKALKDVDQVVAVSMAHIRRIQGWSTSSLCSRFTGVQTGTIKRYMQPFHQGTRPIHFIAAYSWVTMVLMTSFLKGLKITEPERGVDSDAIEAIIQCGRLPKNLFQSTLDIIFEHLSSPDKIIFTEKVKAVEEQYGSLNDYNDQDFLPPKIVDLNDFGNDYYYSLALAFQDFRKINSLSAKDMAAGLGLSLNRYKMLEDHTQNKLKAPFSLHIGIRIRQVFHTYSHVEFTKYMKQYPQFHQLRIVQHIRDTLLVEGLRLTPITHKKRIIQIMKLMAQNNNN